MPMHAGSKIIPQKNSAFLSPGIFAGIVLGITAIGVGAIVFFFNPSTHRFYPVCLFHAMTGLNCPGCGMTRSMYALLHGNFLRALQDNALFVLVLIAMGIAGAHFIFKKLKDQPAAFKMSPKFLWLFLVIALIFATIRNLPGFEWLSP
jgi:hypothetical protein